MQTFLPQNDFICHICFIVFIVIHDTGNRPYWWDLPKVLSDIFNDVQSALSHALQDLTNWAEQAIVEKDPVKLLTGGKMDLVRVDR